jgi:hypothetical protein
MIATPMDVLKEFPIRKNKKQKQAFREAVQSYCEGLGYTVSTEKGSMGARNVVIGSPETAKYLVTAHYDTPAAMFVPNLITPCNFFTFLGYQLAVTALILGTAAVPAMLFPALGLDSRTASLCWLACVYVLLGFMMFGPGNKHNANDNTSGVVTVLETAKALPAELRNQVCFVLFDLEEAGLVGSSAYAKKHKNEVKNQIVLNFDCVGDGDYLLIFPTKKLKKDASVMEALRNIPSGGSKTIAVRENGFSYYPSDQKNFPLGVGIAAFRKNKWGILYCDKIHTRKDTVLDENNVIFLRDRLIALISGNAAE